MDAHHIPVSTNLCISHRFDNETSQRFISEAFARWQNRPSGAWSKRAECRGAFAYIDSFTCYKVVLNSVCDGRMRNVVIMFDRDDNTVLITETWDNYMHLLSMTGDAMTISWSSGCKREKRFSETRCNA